MKTFILAILFLCFILTGCNSLKTNRLIRSYEINLADSSPTDTTPGNITENRDSQGRQASLLSAFYGLDDAFARGTDQVICEGAAGKDGMPVIFSHEINVTTMQAGDFTVISTSGEVGEIVCVTLAPADDKGELRTALLVGNFGDVNDQPVKVEITGNLLSIDNSLNFKGATVDVIPLEEGLRMVLAEIVPEDEWELGKVATPLLWGGGSGCPEDTQQVVRVTWDGGVTKPGGDEADDVERVQYKVTVLLEDGNKIEATPFALADLGDGDNNHELCLDVADPTQSIFFQQGS
jgi:hypothetical protein